MEEKNDILPCEQI